MNQTFVSLKLMFYRLEDFLRLVECVRDDNDFDIAVVYDFPDWVDDAEPGRLGMAPGGGGPILTS